MHIWAICGSSVRRADALHACHIKKAASHSAHIRTKDVWHLIEGAKALYACLVRKAASHNARVRICTYE